MTNSPAELALLPKLDSIELITVRLPFVQPFATSVHSWAVKEALLLRIESGGVVGWGECVADPDPYYSYETTQTARHIFKDFLLPQVEPDLSFAELGERLRPVRGHGMAKAMLENALLDLVARQRGLPLHELLGWPSRRIQSGISIGIKGFDPRAADGSGGSASPPVPPRQGQDHARQGCGMAARPAPRVSADCPDGGCQWRLPDRGRAAPA